MSALRGALKLTPRQKKILGLVIAGRTNQEIAAEIGTTLQAVKTQLYRAYEYFGVSSVRQFFPILDRVREEIADLKL